MIYFPDYHSFIMCGISFVSWLVQYFCYTSLVGFSHLPTAQPKFNYVKKIILLWCNEHALNTWYNSQKLFYGSHVWLASSSIRHFTTCVGSVMLAFILLLNERKPEGWGDLVPKIHWKLECFYMNYITITRNKSGPET